MKRFRILCTVLCLVLCLTGTAFASQSMTIDINGPGQNRVNMTLAEPFIFSGSTPDVARSFSQLVEQNLGLLPFIQVVPASRILGGAQLKGVTRDDIDFHRFQVSRVDMVATAGWRPDPAGGSRLECRVYESFGSRLLVGKAYAGVNRANVARVADLFCEAFMKALTGRSGFFSSTLAFTKTSGKKGQRNIWTVTPQGRNLRQVTFMDGASSSPSWSPDGRFLAFAHHSNHEHTLGLWDSRNNRIFMSKVPGTTIGGTAFTSQGNVVIALTRGNMEIFELTRDLTRIKKTLVQNWAIDVSPDFSADGKTLAFASDRFGNPHIFTRDMATGKISRVTYDGKYNTSPSLSPDGKMVVFSRRTDEGHRIFVHEIDTGRERQLTFGPGSDEEPAFSPDGYFICFASNRSGKYQLYLTTRHGAEPKRIPTGNGDATQPAFGPRSR